MPRKPLFLFFLSRLCGQCYRRSSFEIINAPKSCSSDIINAIQLSLAALLSAYKSCFLFVQEEKRATEISKMDVASQKDKSSSKTDFAAMAASLKVSF